MKDSTWARQIDRHAGQLICFLLSLFHVLKRVLGGGAVGGGPQTSSELQPQKILIMEMFEMGAAVMLIPTIRYIKKMAPQAQLYCLTTSTCFPLWEKIAEAEDIKIINIKAKGSWGFFIQTLRTLWSLRNFQFDLILDFELFMRVPAIVSGCLRGQNRAGFYKYQLEGLYRGNFYNHRCFYNQNLHISKNFLALAKVALEKHDSPPNLKKHITHKEVALDPLPSLQAGHSQQARVEFFKKNHLPLDETQKYIVVCPSVGKNLAIRNYPSSHLAQVLKGFREEFPDLSILLLGTQDDVILAQEVLDQIGDRIRTSLFCYNLCGKTSFSELLAVIAGAELLIGNDNGPAHFAVLTGTKSLVLFSTDSPFVYGPLGECLIVYSFFHCSPCISATNHKRSSCQDNKCLQVLPPTTVLNYAKDILRSQASLGTINNQIPYIL